jgi:exonuclease III
VTLNLRHGGGRHREPLARWLLASQADVLVLTEFRHGVAGNALRRDLAAGGFAHQATSHKEPRRNAILIAARRSFRVEPQTSFAWDRPRLFNVRLRGLSVTGVHLPNLAAKIPHWQALLAWAGTTRGQRRLLIGDFNTGRNPDDAEGYRFLCAGQFAALEREGWVEAWRHLHPEGREFSWYSHKGRGFRLDHGFLSPAAAPLLRSSAYAHEVREQGYTDHSALVVELELPLSAVDVGGAKGRG